MRQEFNDSFKSIRSILIAVFFIYISYESAGFISRNPDEVSELLSSGMTENQVYTAAIALVILIFGFLFTFAISHDIINREIETKTIRLLVTKVSRTEIVLGKFLGVMLFWIATVTLSYGVLGLITKAWFPKDYIHSVVFLFYCVSFVLLLSSLINKTRVSMFAGILLGIAIPIIGLVAEYADKWHWVALRYVLPFHYLEGAAWLAIVPVVIGTVYLVLSIFLLKGKDL